MKNKCSIWDCKLNTGILHTSFYCTSFSCPRYCVFFFSQIEFLWQPCTSYQAPFLQPAFAYLISVSHFGNSHISNFSLLLYLLWWSVGSVTFDVTTITVLGCHKLYPNKTTNLTDKCCMCSECSTDWPFSPSLSLSSDLSILRHNNIKIRPTNNLTMASNYSSGKNIYIMSLTLYPKLEMINLREESMSKVKTGWKLGLFHQTAKLWRQKKSS